MKHDRPGDWLWDEWDGEWSADCIVYATFGDIDPHDDLIRRALASALQRDGVAESLADGYRMIDSGTISQGHSGIIPGEEVRVVCDIYGDTRFGDLVAEDTKDITTWLEI